MPSFPEILDDFLVRNFGYFNYKSYVNRMNLQGNERVLEVGCGGGNLSRFLAEKLSQGRLVCIDNSEYWIKKAKKKLKKFGNIEFRLEDVLDFNKKNYFDVTVVHYVLHDIVSEKREKVVGNLSESIKERGKICIREPTRENHGISPNKIRNLMIKAGFSEKKSRESYSFPLRRKVYEGIFHKTLKYSAEN